MLCCHSVSVRRFQNRCLYLRFLKYFARNGTLQCVGRGHCADLLLGENRPDWPRKALRSAKSSSSRHHTKSAKNPDKAGTSGPLGRSKPDSSEVSCISCVTKIWLSRVTVLRAIFDQASRNSWMPRKCETVGPTGRLRDFSRVTNVPRGARPGPA
jgi:hypothetical protein